MTLLAGMILATAAFFVARWAWRYQAQVLDVLGPANLLRRLDVRITAVLVHDRSVIVGVRDESDSRSLHTLVVGTGADPEAMLATLREWCSRGSRLQLERPAASDRVEFRHLDGHGTLALRLAA